MSRRGDYREWLAAARAELSAIPPGVERLEWILGVISMTFTQLAVRTFLPWRRGEGDPALDRFAARFGLLVLLAPLYLIVANGLHAFGVGSMFNPLEMLPQNLAIFVATVMTLAAVGLAAWTNLGAAIRGGSRLGGHDVALRLRLAPANLAVLGLCLVVLFAYGAFERYAFP